MTQTIPETDQELWHWSPDPEPCEFMLENRSQHGVPSHHYAKSRCPVHGVHLHFLCNDHRHFVQTGQSVCSVCGNDLQIISVSKS